MKKHRELWDKVGFVALRLLVLLLVLYIVIPVVRQVDAQYETEPVTYITVTESGSTAGTIVRSERLLTSDRPYISFLLDDGEKVAAGGAVAAAV